MANGGRLGIIAGCGGEPGEVIAACQRQGRDFFVIAITGQADPAPLEATPHAWLPLGAIGKAIKRLKAEKAEELVFAGDFQRPKLTELKPDWWLTLFLARHGTKIFDSEDALIDALNDDIEKKEGFRVLRVASILAPA